MPRFYFTVYDRSRKVPDREGTECEDLASAKLEAVTSAKELAKQAIDNDVAPGTICVEILNERGEIVSALTVQEVIDHPISPAFSASCDGS